MRVLVADRHPIFRAGLRSILAACDDVEIVGEAATLDEAARLAARLRPDVVVLDSTPGTAIADFAPEVGVLVLSASERAEPVVAAFREGARGFQAKTAPADDVLSAMRAVARGEAVFSPAAARRLFEHVAVPARPFPELSDRELDVLRLLAEGSSIGEIARRLTLTTKTVRNHISRICTKLQVLDRVQAALKAREAGLG